MSDTEKSIAMIGALLALAIAAYLLQRWLTRKAKPPAEKTPAELEAELLADSRRSVVKHRAAAEYETALADLAQARIDRLTKEQA